MPRSLRSQYVSWAGVSGNPLAAKKQPSGLALEMEVKRLAYEHLDAKGFSLFVKSAKLSSSIETHLIEEDNFTVAHLEFKDGDISWKHSYGVAKRNPTDPEIPERGRRIALIRALRNFGKKN